MNRNLVQWHPQILCLTRVCRTTKSGSYIQLKVVFLLFISEEDSNRCGILCFREEEFRNCTVLTRVFGILCIRQFEYIVDTFETYVWYVYFLSRDHILAICVYVNSNSRYQERKGAFHQKIDTSEKNRFRVTIVNLNKSNR